MTMIIIEGPDGAGKSTLIKNLQAANPGLEMAPRACTALGGPLRGDNMLEWLRDYGAMYGHIYDRHPCLSGAVYGAVFGDPPSDSLRGWLSRLFWGIHENARVIYCRPPRREIVRAVNESAQLDGVARKIHQIIDTYDAVMASMVHYERYDWTKDELPSL